MSGARAGTIFAGGVSAVGVPYLLIKLAVDGGVTPGALALGSRNPGSAETTDALRVFPRL
jgi:hypothetical protein